MDGPTISSAATIVASPRQVSTDLEGESVILNLDQGFYYGLEGVGARIWELVREPIPVADLLERLIADYNVERERCEADLHDLLAQLADAGLIEVADESSA